MALLVLTLAVVAGTAWRYLHGALTYLDNGDGLYLYPAWRLAQGARLYRDVMGTQPPLVFLLGAAVFKGGFGLTGIRLFSLTMRGLCVALVYLLGRRLFQGPVVAALAALLYALLPIGLTWDRTFNSNSPLTLVLLLSACALVRLTPRAARASGLLAALGLFTKDLYLPLLAVTVVYLALRQRRLLASYLQGVIGGVAAGGIALAMYAGPGALRDAFLGQASSPANPAWLVASLYYVVAAEGAVLLLALIGGLLCLRGKASVEANGPGGYTPYLLAGSAAVLVATLKEGTFGTVFALTEPAVALLAAHGAVMLARRTAEIGRYRPVTPRSWATPLALGALCFVACSSLGILVLDSAALATDDTAAVARIAALVSSHAPPGSTILAPPYYGVLTRTRVPGDVSDTYIMLQRARHGDRVAVQWLNIMTQAVMRKRYPVVVVDNHIAAFAPVIRALARGYHPVYADALPPSIHAVVWLPLHAR